MANVDNSLQGGEMELWVRVAGSSDPWLLLVCTLDDSFQLTNEVTEKDSRCGTHLGIKTAKGNVSGNAVANIDPSSSECSYDQVTTWQLAKTLVEYKYQNGAMSANGSNIVAGDAIYFRGEGYFTDTTLNSPEGDTVDFSFTFRPSSVSKTVAS